MAEDPGEAVSKMRIGLYRDLYGRAYTHGTDVSDQYDLPQVHTAAGDDPVLSRVRPRSKPFIPPTDFNPEADAPYGNVVGPPLG